MNLQASIRESLSDEQIQEWILDLSESSDLIQEVIWDSFEKIVWQEKAKHILKDILEEIISWVNIKQEWYDKPIANMMFAGPSGVGKTLFARVTQKVMNRHFWNELEMIKINCWDFWTWSNLWMTRLTWASAWYIGSDRKPTFHPDNVEWKWRVILFDEIEKAWPQFWNLLLSVLDDGVLDIDYTDMSNTNNMSLAEQLQIAEHEDVASLKARFSESIIIMTSNVWNTSVEQELTWKSVWFAIQTPKKLEEVDVDGIILRAFNELFLVELQWRLDHVVTFNHLQQQDAEKIVEQLIQRLITNVLSKWNGFVIEFTDSVKQKIVNDLMWNTDFRKFWGRAIESYFRKNIVPYVSRAVNSWNFRHEGEFSCLLVTTQQDKIIFSKVPIAKVNAQDIVQKTDEVKHEVTYIVQD